MNEEVVKAFIAEITGMDPKEINEVQVEHIKLDEPKTRDEKLADAIEGTKNLIERKEQGLVVLKELLASLQTPIAERTPVHELKEVMAMMKLRVLHEI